jgi:hypothetical protein
MKKRSWVSGRIAMVAVMVALPFAACDDDDDDDDNGGTTNETAALTVAMEVPAPMGAANASGSFQYQLDNTTRVMTYTLTAMNLTGPATMAHIHKAPPGMAGPIVIPLAAPSTGTATGTVTLTPEQVTDLLAGALYVNVHTAMNPPGEIRAQLDGR